MRALKASEFKAKCLELVDEVAKTGEQLVIFKNGTPVAQFRPVTGEPRSIWGLHEGQIEILGDIISPIDAQPEDSR